MTSFLETAKAAVQLCSKEIRQAFLAEKRIEQKADQSMVTETDRATEVAIQAFIHERYPDHAILGEELGGIEGSSDYRWVIDPIDGTSNFARGIPIFTSAVALLEGDTVIVAAAYQPMTGDLFWAERGAGAFRNSERLGIKRGQTLAAGLVAFGRTRGLKAPFTKLFAALHERVGAPRILGSAIVSFCHVASGRLDASVSLTPHLWDVAPGLLIAQEAGAVGLDFSGKPWQPGVSELILAHPELAMQLVHALRDR